MKKSKVGKLIRRFKAESYEAGRKQGRAEERERYEQRMVFDSRGEPHIWIGERPKSERIVVMADPDRARVIPMLGPDPEHLPHHAFATARRIEFDLEICAINFSNGMSFRWATWKPRGPYPVTKLAELRAERERLGHLIALRTKTSGVAVEGTGDGRTRGQG